MNKRLTTILSATLCIALLSGCTQKSSEQKTDKDKSEKVATVKVLTKDEFNKAKDSALLVDARSNDEFNGWAVNGSKNGGHIKNATDFSAGWLDCEYDEKKNLEGKTREEVLEDAINNKQLKKASSVVVYDTNGKDAGEVADYLASKGVKNVSQYTAKDEINNKSVELVSYPRYDILVPANYVKDIIDGKKDVSPELKGFDKDNTVIVDVRWGDDKESGYLEGHVPTAVHVNTDEFEPPKEHVKGKEEWRLTNDDDLVKLLLKNGITSEKNVIITSPEPMAASRFGVICKYLGVKDVRIMNGGLVVWNGLGYDLEKKKVNPKSESDFKSEYPKNQDIIVTIPELKEKMKDKDAFELVDVRTKEEYDGKISGYSYHNIKGRIENAKYGQPGLKDSSSMYFYRNIDKTMRNADEIKAMWKKNNIDINKPMTFMCGSGWRAAEALRDARVMGLDKTDLYSDGWIAWSNEGNPYIGGK